MKADHCGGGGGGAEEERCAFTEVERNCASKVSSSSSDRAAEMFSLVG